MASPPEEFPEIADKLKGPIKRSAYDREKAEREAKRRRDEAENAAALKEFEKSMQSEATFEDEHRTSAGFSGPQRSRVGTGGRRLYAAAMPNSGPGTLEGFGRRSGPPRRRTFEEQDSSSPSGSDDEAEDEANAKAAAHRPALRISNLPPNTPTERVKSLIPYQFGKVEIDTDVPTAPRTGERKSEGRIVTFPVGTASNEVDSLIASLNQKYMGKGYYLHVSRYLKTPPLNQPILGALDRNREVKPFGAKLVQHTQLDIAPLPEGQAPSSSSRNQSHQSNNQQSNHSNKKYEVVVQIPELKQMRMINKTIELVIKYGPEFEYELMADEDVIRDEKWAFLWDSSSAAGIYYRYRLWEIASGRCSRNLQGGRVASSPVEIFAWNARWVPPKAMPPFEFATKSSDFTKVYDYDPESDDDMDDDGGRKYNRSKAPVEVGAVIREECLNPLDRYMLIWLLAGMPTTTANVTKSDVAAVMDFAITHGNRGAEEIVDILVTNVERPYCFTSANPKWERPADCHLTEHAGLGAREQESENPGGEAVDKPGTKKEDDSSARLVALFLISDVISAARNANVPGAWRYRELFRKVLLERRVFAKLGRLDRDYHWGRLKADNWKRSITSLLEFWLTCGACLAKEHAALLEDFNNPILTAEEKVAAEKKAKEEAEHKRAAEKKAKEEAELKKKEEIALKQAEIIKNFKLLKEKAAKMRLEGKFSMMIHFI